MSQATHITRPHKGTLRSPLDTLNVELEATVHAIQETKRQLQEAEQTVLLLNNQEIDHTCEREEVASIESQLRQLRQEADTWDRKLIKAEELGEALQPYAREYSRIEGKINELALDRRDLLTSMEEEVEAHQEELLTHQRRVKTLQTKLAELQAKQEQIKKEISLIDGTGVVPSEGAQPSQNIPVAPEPTQPDKNVKEPESQPLSETKLAEQAKRAKHKIRCANGQIRRIKEDIAMARRRTDTLANQLAAIPRVRELERSLVVQQNHLARAEEELANLQGTASE